MDEEGFLEEAIFNRACVSRGHLIKTWGGRPSEVVVTGESRSLSGA